MIIDWTYVSDYDILRESYAGVWDPADMGTTGLIGWVIAGPEGDRKAYNRLRRALKIVRARRGSVEGFSRAVLKAIPNHAQRNRFAGYFDSLLNQAN